ncbi:MAG: 3-deoxy-manno-octulosonate cytidylyltransferase [Pseudomonadota bacterium]
MKTVIVIPARMGSTRFPGKPLALIAGRSMISRVVAVAKAAADEIGAGTDVFVATDAEEIAAEATRAGAAVIMAIGDYVSGTDRINGALEQEGVAADFVLNLQGDAPFTPPAHLVALAHAAKSSSADVFTPVVRLDWEGLDQLRQQKEEHAFSGTTCVFNERTRAALWFSKAVLPMIRNEQNLREASSLSPVYRHIGLYGYRRSALTAFCQLPTGHFEELEGLEQLRFLENGISIDVIDVPAPNVSVSGIDTPDDIKRVEDLLEELGDPGIPSV